jgi:hypothetical protein
VQEMRLAWLEDGVATSGGNFKKDTFLFIAYGSCSLHSTEYIETCSIDT